MKGIWLTWLCLLLVSVVYGQTTGEYRSNAAVGNWNAAGSWQSFNGAIWVAAGTPPTGNEPKITIQGGHNISIPTGAPTFTITTQLDILSSGTLTIVTAVSPPGVTKLTLSATGTINNSGTITITIPGGTQTALVIAGTLVNSGIINSTNLAKIKFNANSVYQHAFTTAAGTIPTATWAATSTCKITSTNDLTPSGLGQSFGNFEWNYPTQTAFIDLAGALTTVTGNLSLISSQSVGVALGSGYTLNIGGSFLCNDYFEFNNGGGSAILNVTGNFTVNDPTATGLAYLVLLSGTGSTTVNITGNFLADNLGGADMSLGGSGSCTINLSGSYTTQNGGYLISGSGTGTYQLNFTGSTTQTVIESQSLDGIDISIPNSGSSIFIPSGSGNNFLGTDKSFTLGTGATLQVGSTHSLGAIQTGTANGNIRVSGLRTYASGSTIVYKGIAAQFIGNGHPSAVGVKTQVSNSNGVSLASDVTIGGELELVDLPGTNNLSVGSHILTFSDIFTPNDNFLNVISGSSLVINGTGSFGTLATTGSTTINNFTLNRTSAGTVTLGSNLAVAGTLTQSSGDIIIGSNTLTIGGSYGPAVPGGDLLTTNSSTVIVNGSGTLPTDVGFSGSGLGTLTLSRSGATLPTTSSVTITNLNLVTGTFSNAAGITMSTGGIITRTTGSMATSPANITNSYDVVYTSGSISTGPELPSNSTALANLSKTGTGILNLISGITINGVFTLSNGSFVAGSNTINLKGNFISNATSSLASSAITFSGTTTISGSISPTFGNITISGVLTPTSSFQINGNLINNGTLNAGSGTATFGGTTAITGSSTSSFNNVIVSNTLTAPSGTMNIAGNFTNNGTFNHNNGTITFNGTTSILGSATTSLFAVNITGTLTAPSTTLNVAGNLANSGTFNSNGGTVTLNGTTGAQAITGTYAMNDINVSNPSGVNNNGTIGLSGTLSLVSSGIFDADGAGSGVLTIRSTSVNAGGRIATLSTPANFTGQVTVERFINGPDSWRYLSMPLTNGNVGMWQSFFPVTGNFSNPSPNGVNGVISPSSPSIYSFNSATQAYVAVGSGGTTGATSLSNLTGYSSYTYLPGNFTISARGSIRTGNATIPIATTGFALVPNPYPSTIDWDNVTRTGLNSTMSLRVSNNVFATYVAGGPSTNPPFVGWTGEVAIGQSFWIQSSGASSLNLTESIKTSNQYQFLRDREPQDYLRIALSSESQRDETLIWFVDGASRKFDDTFDALKMRNGYFEPEEKRTQYLNISTLSEDGTFDYAINSIEPLSCNRSITLRVRDVSKGPHSLSFTDLETMTKGYKIVLIDHFLSTENVVADKFEYKFQVTDDESSFGDDRFDLRFIVGGTTQINSQKLALSIISQCDPEKLPVTLKTQDGVFYQFFSGSTAITDAIPGNGSQLSVDILKNKLNAGTGSDFISVVASTKKGCESLTFKDALSYELLPLNPIVITTVGNTLVSNVNSGNQWYKNDNPISEATGQSYEVKESGTYSVRASIGGCSISSGLTELLIMGTTEIANETFNVYPNPTSGKMTLKMPVEIEHHLRSILVFDIKGNKVLEDSNPELLSGTEKVIDLTDWNAGFYLLTIISDKIYHLKIVRK
jgi:hypothetical protein